ncbi:threonine/serine exporter family protein [Anoxybacillus sp. J5B_2022]|uniref:threonine/serine exporter family protein n=1 Tax=Anoxybacillus sp. J5B_2022 TaxID=3003246 RepID=UPI0022859755|nr:threonine/serine exporter family protein [Anoxybacillus sp. J5B_2022]MCZ0756088.1 threonine/serine exporter family protein [Anoxybacillus sp. J5B_2022]
MLIEQLVTSFIASAAFGLIFNVPKKLLAHCGLVGMSGWFIYILFVQYDMDSIFATFVAAFFVAVVSQVLARMYKTPMTIFSVSGIIPLVPGGLAYEAMRHVVVNDYNMAIQLAAKAFMISGAIAMGLIFSEVINQMMKTWASR